MDKPVLHATRRTVIGKQVGALRREGKLPAVLYGHEIAATPITLDLRETSRLLNSITSSSIISVELDGKENATLVREKQKDYIRGTLLHVDFQVVSLTEKIRTEVSIEITGLAPAIKDFNGVMVTGVDEIEVECLPKDLPDRIVVDISTLANIGDGIYVRDIPVPENVVFLAEPDEMIVLITHPAAEEVEEVVEPVIEEPEVIERGKKEEEVPPEEPEAK
jgi:large subunit ribosomal protein L25